MDLKQAILNNTGMQQDLSISKDTNNFAYKNLNIRIQATGDGTLASVTNLKSPLKIEGDNIIPMLGKVLNSIMCGKYIVVFTHSDNSPYKDYIYRIDLENNFSVNELYKGDLNFSFDKPIDSTFYYENDKIQKVYWVDGWTSDGHNNYPRVINIITEGERNGGNFTTYDASTNFDFYPEIKYIPSVSATKNFDIPSELPAGVIQYFVSFFNKNQSETLIAAGTSLYSIDLKSKGAKADDTGCAFNVTVQIKNEAPVQDEWASSYGYIRLYSVRRTSIDGDATVSIVKDFKIEENITSYSVVDNGIGQETIDPGQIFFVGGTPLFAKTLCQKDNTLFVGGIKTEGVIIDKTIKDRIHATIKDREQEGSLVLKEAVILTEDSKNVPVSSQTFNSYYPYKLQKDNEYIITKTFKVGEIYRFGIQFQTKQGQWSEVVWIGDKKISNFPTYNDSTSESNPNTFSVSNIRFYTDSPSPGQELDEALQAYKDIFIDLKRKGFTNYRLVMADAESSNGRSILAQGVVNPTMFSPSLRTKKAPYAFNSWIMRPRKGAAPYHHLEPLHSAKAINSELSTYDPQYSLNDGSNYLYHNMPFKFVPFDGEDLNDSDTLDNNFYIDESVVNLYSPEITKDTIFKGTPKFRIIGVAPLNTNYSTAEVKTKNIGIDLDYTPGVDNDVLKKYRVDVYSSSNISPLYGEYMYTAPMWKPTSSGQSKKVYRFHQSLYNIHMWQYSKSIIGFNKEEDKVIIENDHEITIPEEPLVLESNSFYNHLFSESSVYFNESLNYDISKGFSFYNGTSQSTVLNPLQLDIYDGYLDTLHENEKTEVYRKNLTGVVQYGYRDKEIIAASRIVFDSYPHAVFYLGNDTENVNKLKILPVFSNETPYKGIITGKYDLKENVWKDLSESTSKTAAETHLYDLFNKRLNQVGSLVKAGWSDSFAFTRDGDVTDIYDQNTYKSCCFIDAGNQSVESIIRNGDVARFPKYNYKEVIGSTTYNVIIGHRTSWDKPKKFYWNDITHIYSIDMTDEELFNTTYPVIYSNGRDWSEKFEGGTSYLNYYVFPHVTKEYDEFNDRDIYNTSYNTYNKFTVFDSFGYTQDIIDGNSPTKPYLFIGELYYDIPYESLYGGYDENDLSKLKWIPISKPKELITRYDGLDYVTVTEGDTYYQRWDCLKTFPKTLEDINKVTDITSFMVETHINLDERTDPNRASFNIVSRPDNFNLFNTVYNQKNNLFSYTTLNELLSNENSHQVSWSLTKNVAGTVDTWTNITSVNTVNLKHPITKLVNFNNKVVGLTEHSVEVINFNARNLVPTDDNTFIELKNSAKVDGTIDFTIDKGSTNKSVLVTEAGLYFIDDNENSLIRINYSGEIKNLGTGRMDSWFKQNTVSGTYTINNQSAFHLEYDAKYKDVYICNDSTALIYSEPLDAFTSFVDYQELVSLFTNNGSTYAIALDSSLLSNNLYDLYGGTNYGYGFYNKQMPYSVHYRVNPGPYSDKVFTNIEFRADLQVSQENKTVSNNQPFDYIQAWTEYQDTTRIPLVYGRLKNLREKFRTWNALIPRNYGTRDRIRNPWMHLKLDSDHCGDKLEFHNIAVTYME